MPVASAPSLVGRARLLAAVAAILLAASMAGALTTSAGRPAPATPGSPASAADRGATPLVLAGRGRRPVWSYVVVAPDGGGDLGSATVGWSPSGPDGCPAAAVPLGIAGTGVSVLVDRAGTETRLVGDLGPAGAGCRGASGTWRSDGSGASVRRGSLAVRLDDDGIVRLTFDG